VREFAHERRTKKADRNVCTCFCEYISACVKRKNIGVFDRPGAKMNDVSENCAYSSDKSLFSKLP